MNAAIIYSKLSRKVLLLNDDSDDEALMDFVKQDKELFKLRTLLLCRSCRTLCLEPFSSDFCKHLICKNCLDENKARNPGCKWCRNEEDLIPDMQSKILVGLYKKLCAILHDFVTGSVEDSGSSAAKQKLLKFLNEGCSIPDVVVSKELNDEESSKVGKNISSTSNIKIIEEEKQLKESCPKCCCKCGRNGKTDDQVKDFSNDPVAITAAQSSGINIEHEKVHKSPEYVSDAVSSTVPDSIPVDNRTCPVSLLQNKYGGIENGGNNLNSDSEVENNSQNNCKYETLHEGSGINNNVDKSKISPSKFYKTLSSLKEKKNRSIFEKFGLALSPPSPNSSEFNESIKFNESSKKQKKKKHPKGTEKKKKRPSEPKLQPIKLKVKKIKSLNSSVSGYSVYNIAADDSEQIKTNDEEYIPEEVNYPNQIVLSDSSELEVPKKVRRKASTFISNYAIFSDDSDFESIAYYGKRARKSATPKQDRETCGCGAGSTVKYFTDICKRARCPCFSKGKACVNCKCRYCSNPFLLNEEVKEIYSDSDSSQDQPLIHWVKDENEMVDVDVDVETM